MKANYLTPPVGVIGPPITRKIPNPHSLLGNIGYVDGHSGKLSLQQLKTVYWHVDYIPVDDVWKTTPPPP